MGIYIGLLAFIIVTSFFINISSMSTDRKKILFLNIMFISIFLLYSLRASSVGRDLPGYERAYIIAGEKGWLDYSYVYFENGYIFLMKVCNYIGLSFQGFLAIVDFIILVPIYIFFRKYSNRPFLSVMVYVCYMFFEFNMTAIRQAIATSIVLIGIILLIEAKRFGIVKYTALVYLATLFHSGAFIAFFYIPFHFIKKQKYYVSMIVSMSVVFLIGRNSIMTFIKTYFGKASMNASAGVYIGLNFMFLVGLAVLFIYAEKNREIRLKKEFEMMKIEESNEKYCWISSIFNKMFLLSIAALILFGSDTSVRSYMILNQVVLILLPNCVDDLFADNSKKGAVIGITVFLILFFFNNTLLDGGFDIVPYKFFWQIH